MTGSSADLADWTIEDGEVTLDAPVTGVDIRVPGGSVTVAVADGPPRVAVADAVGGAVTVRHVGGLLTVRQHGPEGVEAVDDIAGSLLAAFGLRPGGGRRATVTVLVPTPVRVAVRTLGGEVMFSGLEEATVDTVAGDVTISRHRGSLRVASINGGVQAAGIVGRVSATTVSGDVTIAGGDLAELRLHTVSGDAIVDVELREGNHAFQSVSGNLALRMLAPAGFDLDATSVAGHLSCAVGTPVDVSRPGLRRLRAIEGAGGAHFRSHTVSGDVAVLLGASS